MIPRFFLATLVFALPVLIVVFAVVIGASLLTQALGDVAGARMLFWAAMTALILLVIDALLLLAALGLRALDAHSDQTDDEMHP
jgi:hypothetical protein